MRIRPATTLICRVLCAAVLGLASGAAAGQGKNAAPENNTASNYRLGSGDVISIQVLGEDDLKREKIRLSDAATISYPIHEIAAQAFGLLKRLMEGDEDAVSPPLIEPVIVERASL